MSDPDATEVLLSSVSTSLSSHFPLPFRILVLVSFGILCWALNLHVLHLLGIDTALILDIRNDTTGQHIHPSKLYPGVYQLAGFYAAWTGFCWIVGFQLLAAGDGDATAGKLVSGLSVALAVAFLLLPLDKLKRQERGMFLRSLRRTATDLLRPVPFCDVILADILTSFAKVGGDVWVCICSLVFAEDDTASRGTSIRDAGIPFMIALPYIFRFRQCIAEYLLTPSSIPHHPTHSHSHAPSIFLAPTSASSTPSSPKQRALLNSLKYASAFPVIIFSALQGKFGDPHDHGHMGMKAEAEALASTSGAWLSPTTLFRIWVLSVLVNSLFSFWWDITNDWGLHLLLPSSRKSPNSTILRRTLLLPDTTIYYLIILLDFILRCTWSLKLSSHLHSIHEIEMGIFMLEALEVLRRWIWVYLRIEWEAVRKGGDVLEDRMRGGHSVSDLNLPLLATPAGGSPQSPPPPQMSQQDGPSGSGAGGLDRRVSASHRKTSGKPFAADQKGGANGYGMLNVIPPDEDDADEMGMGRSGVLVDLPSRK